MKIKIICIGKLKEDYFIDAQNYYISRISRRFPLEIIELPDSPDSPRGMTQEAALIKRHIDKGDYLVCAAIEGSALTPQRLNSVFTQKDLRQTAFVIGGSLGIADEIKEMSSLLLSFSALTFTHRLARLVLLDAVFNLFFHRNG